MKILFTGASSFTGYWFVKELTSAGHEVIATMRRQSHEYDDPLRARRVAAIQKFCDTRFGIAFGDDSFLAIIKERTWDLFCHHAADVTNYRDPNFDVVGALKNNTCQLPKVHDLLGSAGCGKLIVTGSVFENDEGAGAEIRDAFSPYGLSKGLSWQVFRYYVQARGMTLGKFVIPNPFGAYEEPRFTHYLIKNWFAGTVPSVNTPSYVRDNIHASLLAKAYRNFAESPFKGIHKINPSGYVESQGAFAKRVASEMSSRLALACELKLNQQTDFSEPLVRINTDRLSGTDLQWNETAAWDDMAAYYDELMRGG
jgi:UDP-glucose 4-epimerase